MKRKCQTTDTDPFRDWNEPTDSELQVHPKYTLTDQDILRLYGLFTPQQIYDQFKWEGMECTNCRAVRSIYRLVRRYNFDSPSVAKKHPKNGLWHTFQTVTPLTIGTTFDETLAVARAEATAENTEEGEFSLRRMDAGFQSQPSRTLNDLDNRFSIKWEASAERISQDCVDVTDYRDTHIFLEDTQPLSDNNSLTLELLSLNSQGDKFLPASERISSAWLTY